MTQNPQDQNISITPESVKQLVKSKLINFGISGALLLLAVHFARNSEWKKAGLCAVAAVAVWFVKKLIPRIDQRIDKLLDWIFSNAERLALDLWAKLTSDFEGKYYQRLKFDCREYEIRGINRGALQLENVFVPLKMAQKVAEQIPQDINYPRELINPLEQQEIGNLLVQMKRDVYFKRLAILGAPGCGKSTLLRHIILMYATRKQRRLHPKAPKLIPVLLQLRDIYQEIIQNPEIPLAEIIENTVKKLQASEPLQPRKNWFAKRLRESKCLVMLDGLDEIPDDEQRQNVSAWVDKQIGIYPDSCFILTSRPEGYRQAPLTQNVCQLEVQPFIREQRDKFIQDWYFHRVKREYNNKVDLGVRDRAKKQANNLIEQIEVSSSLKLMARNPLLLNMIAITHEPHQTLSNKRVDLYKEICRVLLEGRQRVKGQTTLLSAEQKQSVLKSLALELMQQNTQAFTLDEFSRREKTYKQAKSLIKDKLDRFPQVTITPEDFIKKDDIGVRELLSDKQQEGIYEFAHKTFQEYFAAVEIKDSRQENLLLEAFNDETKLAWWRETIRFYAAQTDASQLIANALNHANISVLALAYQCSKEAQELEPSVKQQLTAKLEQGLASNNLAEFTLAAEVKLADRMSQLNHDFLDEINVEQDSITVDSSYITWAEYQLFFNETSTPSTLANKRQAQQPVTNISFWDANRFCAWLSLRSRQELAEPGICYRQALKPEQNADGKIQLLRFQIPTRYAQLAYYLAAGKWKEADEETFQVMLEAAGSEKHGFLELEDIREFPCEDLRIIDQLWVNYSNGHFGFSVQKDIYLSVGGILEGSRTSSPFKKVLVPFQWIYTRFGGRVRDKEDEINKAYKAYQRFSNIVGWNMSAIWSIDPTNIRFIDSSKVNYSTIAPKGHLPTIRDSIDFATEWTTVMSFLSRVEACQS
ncbi:putative NTPase (NACHT family) [Nostoc sp. PCC 7524]|uniref:GUN4 domain-containing protein n=1 Tax=Nostoc sp. (strain ATCC 29411 / PCC 7524) TaxID=28072 RepID=UPI00029F1978|nr:GUN4 domain-containing protein [Nostoc sp. PCC 7524]AFY50772.1 putative NTPase (NACHT family) [Nostoc sp. PCC 7524]